MRKGVKMRFGNSDRNVVFDSRGGTYGSPKPLPFQK